MSFCRNFAALLFCTFANNSADPHLSKVITVGRPL